jgi:NADPH2:quinone reductase
MLNIASSHAVKMPDHLDFESAACLGIPALTALQATRLCGPLEGKTVLVTGAGSAVGHYASQMARMAGAHVIGTVGSAARAAHALSAGVEHLINYKTESIVDEVARITEGKGVDCVIDMDFSSTCQLLQTQAIANHSKVVCYGSNSPDVGMPFRPLLWKSVDLKFMLVYDLKPKDREECLASLNEMLVNKALVHAVAKTTTLEDIASAHEWVESGKVIGNVVLQVQKP